MGKDAGEPILSVGVLPWLTLNEPILVGAVTFFPSNAVREILGERYALLEDRLRIYRDTWHGKPVQPAIALEERQLRQGGYASARSVREATDILIAASIFENDGGPSGDANATTFTLFFQRLGGGLGFMATRTRRRYGGLLVGSTTELQVVRPVYAGSMHHYNRELVEALIAARTHNDAWHLFDALKWLRRASTDADNIDPEVDLVLLLTAVDFLLALPGTRRRGLAQDRASALLTPFETIPCCSLIKSKQQRSQIQAFLFVLDRVRNETIHPEADVEDASHYSFGKADVAFPWFADRCFMALLVARLTELGVLVASPSFRAFVAGVEQWILDPKDALGKIVLDVKLSQALRDGFVEVHKREVMDIGKEAVTDDLRQSWQRDFFVSISPVPEPLRVEIVWLANGLGAVEIYNDGQAKPMLLDYLLVDPAEDEPTRMAYGAMAHFASSHRLDATDAAPDAPEEALRDPRLFLGGARGVDRE